MDIYYGAMQRLEQLHLIAQAQIVRGCLNLAVIGITLSLVPRIEVAVGIAAAATFMQAYISALRVRRLGIWPAPRFRLNIMAELARLALPLGAAVSVGSLLVNVPRYFVQTSEGQASLGIYAVLTYALVITATVCASLGEAASPRLANQYVAGNKRGFRRTLALLVLCGLVLGLVGVLGAAVLGRFALNTLFGEAYGKEWLVLVVLMVSATVQYAAVFLGTAVNALRLFRVQFPITLGGLVVVTSPARF